MTNHLPDWVPEWAEYYKITSDSSVGADITISFYSSLSATVADSPIEDLIADLSIRDVLQQMKDRPLSERIKQPRYKDSAGDDWIDQSYKDLSWQEFCGAMKFTIGKYMRRLGRKDAEVSELEKVADYAERWAEKARQRINEEV